MSEPRPYLDPYKAGIGIGLVLLAAFVVVGRGLGASGAASTVVASTVRAAAPAHALDNAFYNDYATAAPLQDWLVVEVIGIAIGALLSAWLAGRLVLRIERGPRTTPVHRLMLAFGGGAIMGFGAKLARGCTSGLGLTGGSLLAVGSWVFLIAAFAGAFALAPVVRRSWQ